jgi:uncharacterized protein YjbI with pentapeptide repeats
MGRDAWQRYALAGALALVALASFALLYGELPWWIDGARLRSLSAKDQAGVLGADRGDVLKMVAGAGALVALVYTARKHTLERHGQLTDRYSKAITQLASEKPSERIGGIYALERVMRDSVRDHQSVVEVLAAFVRQQSPLPDTPLPDTASEGSRAGGGSPGPVRQERPQADVQAAMTVLARRPQRPEPFELDLRRTLLARLELPPGARLARVNLAQADLTGAALYGATLRGATLYRATLTGANLEEANLEGVMLSEANLDGVNLARADLTGVVLSGAMLRGTILGGAMLRGAYLSGASLAGAILAGATLTEVVLSMRMVGPGQYLGGTTLTTVSPDGTTVIAVQDLRASQLADALETDSTVLDEALAKDPWVLARIEACRDWRRYRDDPVPAATPDPSGAQQASGS